MRGKKGEEQTSTDDIEQLRWDRLHGGSWHKSAGGAECEPFDEEEEKPRKTYYDSLNVYPGAKNA